jgi:hypothetical protein
MKKSLSTLLRTGTLLLLFIAIVFFQYAYDATAAVRGTGAASEFSPDFVRAIDMGFHAPVASFSWIGTMPEILDAFFNGKNEYFSDLDSVTGIDPKLSYPYAFSVLTVPILTTYQNAIQEANAIGVRGIANADPDWRIPFYMATNYYLELHDKEDALRYFDIAARTPGIPVVSQRFAINFSIGFGSRDQTKALWTAIRDTTNDDFTKQRAQAYIDRLDDLDYLESAAKEYKTLYGVYPKTPDDLVAKNIIPQVPQDPFGFSFLMNPDGTATVDVNHPPAKITQ